MSEKIGVGVNLKVLVILSKYLPKKEALKAAEEMEIVLYDARQDLKETIINEFKLVATPEFGMPGREILPANTIGLIDERYDYRKILDTPFEDIRFSGIPKEYLE